MLFVGWVDELASLRIHPRRMSTIIQEIREKLARFPDARIEFDDSSITCFPSSPNGFAVRLAVHPGITQEWYSIHYNGSHEEFDNRHTAILTFALGLSSGCRLREYSRMGSAYRWVVDLWEEDKQRWKPDWEIVRFTRPFWLFWRRSTMRCLQNRLIDLDSGDAAHAA